MHFDSRLSSRLKALGLAVAAGLSLSAGTATAQSAGAMMSPPMASTQAELSPDQLAEVIATARPMEQMLGSAEGMTSSLATTAAMATQTDGAPVMTVGFSGASVSTVVDEAQMRAINEAAAAAIGENAEGIAPQNYGSGNLNSLYHFNDYLQFPRPYFYPQRTIGKLYFQASDGFWYHCTATLVNYHMLVTAGHCVYEGGTGDQTGWNMDGYFVPSFSAAAGNGNPAGAGGNYLYGYCRVLSWGTTGDWYNIGDLNGGYDVGMGICGALENAVVSRYNNRAPGGRLGFLGVCASNCRQNYWFLTQYGYPANYYGGGEMTVSQHVEVTGMEIPPLPSGWYGIDYIYGTGMRGGSSGGPHISNVGEISDSAYPGEYLSRNVIFAVTSWGYTSDIYKLQGASPLSGYNNGNDFPGLWNLMCGSSRNLIARWTCTTWL